MQKKILFIATIFGHFKGFHVPYINSLKEQGWQVDLAAGGEDVDFDNIDAKYYIDIQRSPLDIKNIKAYCQVKDIIDKGDYDIIYCHTAMGAVIARLASIRSRRLGKTKVVYVAHGFHFCKGSPRLYWLIYYPIEKFLSRYTDALVTINKEDFELAKTKKFKCGALYKINGIGVDLNQFHIVDDKTKEKLRNNYNFKKEDFIIIYTAEHNQNKNHKLILDATKILLNHIPNIQVLFAGNGDLFEFNKEYAKQLKIENQVYFLGFRKDIPDLVSASDIAISASQREGLPINIIEALASGIPVVAAVNRGHSELIGDGINGFLFPQNDVLEFTEKIKELYKNKELYASLSKNAVESAQKYNISNTLTQIMKIFEKTLK